MAARDEQVGGTHYKKYAIQPFEFAMVNGYDAGASYILKHVTRHADKLGRQDLEKALHYIEFRRQILGEWNMAHVMPYRPNIPMAKYINENRIARAEASILDLLDMWLRHPTVPEYPDKLIRQVNALMDSLYPLTATE